MLHMLDALLIMYLDLPAKMNAGVRVTKKKRVWLIIILITSKVFLTASDVIFLYNGKGRWDGSVLSGKVAG